MKMDLRLIMAKIVGIGNYQKLITDIEIAKENGRRIDADFEKEKRSKEYLEFKSECQQREIMVMQQFKDCVTGNVKGLVAPSQKKD